MIKKKVLRSRKLQKRRSERGSGQRGTPSTGEKQGRKDFLKQGRWDLLLAALRTCFGAIVGMTRSSGGNYVVLRLARVIYWRNNEMYELRSPFFLGV